MQSLKTKILKIAAIFLILAICGLGFAIVLPSHAALAKERAECKGAYSAEKINECIETSPLVKTLKTVVNFLSAGVGVVVTGSIIVGGIQYAAAGNNASAVSAAKKRITDSLIALLVFIFIYAFLQWILPGGLIF